MELGGTQRVQEVPSPGIMEGGTGEPRPQQRYHPALFQPLSHLIEGMMPVEHGEHHSFDSTPTRESVRRMGWDATVNHGGNL